MLPKDSNLGTELKRRNNKRITNATIAARQDIMQCNAL
jgi:hypothetical protein